MATVRRDFSIPLVDLAVEPQRQVIVDREAGQYLGHPTTALLDDDSFLGDEVTLDDDWSGNDEDSSWTGLTHSSLNTAEAEANPDLVANTDS